MTFSLCGCCLTNRTVLALIAQLDFPLSAILEYSFFFLRRTVSPLISQYTLGSKLAFHLNSFPTSPATFPSNGSPLRSRADLAQCQASSYHHHLNLVSTGDDLFLTLPLLPTALAPS
ncbi:hypothetical protein BJ742DRAFT_218320 [Cladochytrium replicatum]|nr:hypothetical protein BJ742DRAFT_218320 [Cladochytrium replicatum]